MAMGGGVNVRVGKRWKGWGGQLGAATVVAMVGATGTGGARVLVRLLLGGFVHGGRVDGSRLVGRSAAA